MLSIIVPVYNTGEYLEKCLDSILNQTRKDFEIIVINDGSTDCSERILKKYEEEYSQYITVVTQENHGIGYTRNKGIELARGKYITFIDSDDTIEPEYCEVLLHQMENSGLDLAVSDYYEVDERTGTKNYFRIKDFHKTNLIDEPRLLFDVNTSPWNKIYKVQLLREHGIVFPEKVKYEDVIFVLKYLGVAKYVGKINVPLVNYLLRNGGETTTMNAKVFDIFKVLEEIYHYYMTLGIYASVSEWFEWFCINRITVYCIQQQYQISEKEAVRFIEEGFSYLDNKFPDWKKNKYYYQNNGFLKRTLKGNKDVMKMFVKLLRKRRKS